MRVLRGRVWTPRGLLGDAVVEEDDGLIVAVRPPNREKITPGLILPGLVNAHTHLELASLHARVPGGEGFLSWVGTLMKAGDPERAAAEAAAVAMREAGTAWVHDVSNAGDTAPLMAEAGLGGAVHHELLGFDAGDLAARIQHARTLGREEHGIAVRPSPHAVFSTAPSLIEAAVHAPPRTVPATIHLGEAEHEARFLAEGDGPHAALLDRLGRDWRWWEAPGLSPVAYLDALGVLGPDLMLVHGVRLGRADIQLAVRRDAPVVFCPRSNLHIGGRLPDVPAFLDAGVRCALGTDSLASCPDVDVLGEVVALRRAFPDVPLATWLTMVTHGGADVVGAPAGVGRIEVGARAGVFVTERLG